MKFCSLCDNMLYLNILDENVIKFSCRHCGYEEEDANFDPCLYRLSYSKENPLYYKSLVNKYSIYDPTLPHTKNIQCPNKDCESNLKEQKEQDVLYIKYDKVNLKYIYMCVNCLIVWKCPNYEHKDILFQL